MSEEVKEQKTYQLNVECDNCKNKEETSIPFGTRFQEADDKGHSTVACSVCGCYRLERVRTSSPYLSTKEIFNLK